MSKAAELAALIGSGQAQGNKNFIINGDMQVSQRATGATAVGSGYYTIDRFKTHKSNDGAFTIEQSTDNPFGTGNSLKMAVTTADTSVAAGQYLFLSQSIEAQNLQSLLYGTSSAKTVTLSFWVKSNKTGTYVITLYKSDNTISVIPVEYTIDSANTWEKKTITVTPTAGGTSLITASGGAIDNNNAEGMMVIFGLAWGSTYAGGTNNTWSSNSNHYSTSNQVNWMDSTSNNFYLSQVQLEIGDVATPFEHRSFGDELLKCQRYFSHSGDTRNNGIVHSCYTTVSAYANPNFVTTMRTAPTITMAASGRNFYSGNANKTISAFTPQNAGTQNFQHHLQGSGFTSGQAGHADVDANTRFFEADAEL